MKRSGIVLLFLLQTPTLTLLSAQHDSRPADHFPEIFIGGEDPSELFTLKVNGSTVSSKEFRADPNGTFTHQQLQLLVEISDIPHDADISTEPENTSGRDYHCRILRFLNRSGDTLEIENLLPLGASSVRPYITAHGPPGLTRATLFRPGMGPVGLIVPDNAWELGFTALELSPDSGIALLARRDAWEGAERLRYSTLVFPGGEVSYRIYSEAYRGDWRSGLRVVFADRWLYDLDEFDNGLYERSDLQWIREDYLAVLQFAWDHDFYSVESKSYDPFRKFFHRYEEYHGGYDIYAIWQGWPRLGLDRRNQWDLFHDLPGGIDSLKSISRYCKDHQSAFFISYNPWDESTRRSDHLTALTGLIGETGADGVVLDTRGSSSEWLQKAADRAKSGVVMYSEGMAVARDMPGIVSGRVHNAIRMSPPLNLNRLIKPEFQIFRVLDLRDGRLHREMAVSFFNGYGAELNLFSPAHPWWTPEEYSYMGRCLMILRHNHEAFHDLNWVPLIDAPDSIWVNQWHNGDKVLYTLLSLTPRGHKGPLLKIENSDLHWVSLWDHQELVPHMSPGGTMLECTIDPFSPAYTGTRREGSVQCLAGFPSLLSLKADPDSLCISAPRGERILVWKGDPSYSNRDYREYLLAGPGEINIPLMDWMHQPEGKIVIQLMQGTELLDERIILTTLAKPVRTNRLQRTRSYEKAPPGMLEIRGAPFQFYRGNTADFIPYPSNFDSTTLDMEDFYMDRYPVTNGEYQEFILATAYTPADTSNFLKHWKGWTCPDSLADHPVVWVSLEDAREYARWKGRRLPSEAEWQYAAQGTEGNLWPWGQHFDSTACNNASGRTSPVNAHPEGQSPFGIEDLSGNVWQMCNDEYFNGTYSFSMIRGGSFYKPTSSWWYIQGGPQPNNHTQMLLRTAPGFDRSATVGFRCACDM